MVTNAIAYVRVSTDDQTLGPEAQRAAITTWAAREGVNVTAWHSDVGVSGAAPLDKRPGLLAALSELGRGSVLVAAKRCRLARCVVTAAAIEAAAARADASVTTVDGVGVGDGPEAALMRTIVDAFAAYERALIRSRTKSALAAKRARGERTGGVPYGSRVGADGRTLEPCPIEAAIVSRIHGMRADGLSQLAIADALTSEGAPCRGARWHRTTVARVLASAA